MRELYGALLIGLSVALIPGVQWWQPYAGTITLIFGVGLIARYEAEEAVRKYRQEKDLG